MLSFKKKDFRAAAKEYSNFKPHTSISNQSDRTIESTGGVIQNNSCFNFMSAKEAKDSFNVHLAETAASMSNVTNENTPVQTPTPVAEKRPVRRTLSLNEAIMNPKKRLSASISLNDFATIKHLGKGKFGNVSMVMHKPTGLLCAMKALEKSAIN